jgi:hypothetical protein
MSPVTLAELDPVTRQRVLEQIPDAAASTVQQETCETLDPTSLTDDQLADVVIEGVKKIRAYLPYIRTLKERFDSGDRDSTNRLKTPIKCCNSWKEFCETHLDRTTEAIRLAIAGDSPKHTANHPEREHEPTPTKPKSTKPIQEIKELADAIPLIRNGKDFTPPSQYSAADIVETVTGFTDAIVNQRHLTPSDRKMVYLSVIREFQDILAEMAS